MTAVPTIVPTTAVVVDRLNVAYRSHRGDVAAVDDLSFTIDAGRILGIAGESGSGKTTAALALAGLLPGNAVVRCERMSVGGARVDGRSERELRRLRGSEIGFVFQDPMTSLNPVLSVGAQITESIRTHSEATRRDARAQAVALLDAVGIPRAKERLRSYPHELSGGMRQRVMIAMALAADPVLLIADEPTTALDVTVQEQILELLRSACSERQLAVLFITHDLAVAAELCDEMLVMYGGQAVELAPVPQLFDQPQMPYTRGLLACHATLSHDQRKLLTAIPGEPIAAAQAGAGCRFANRCGAARQVCHDETPVLSPRSGSAHLARCWATEPEGWLR